ncbi:MAG: response regulator [Planctomycetes bacterium]|nr:response regulator [Planctomycetota bacterium]
MRVVIAEDQAELRDLLSEFLREEGHDVTACADGQEAYDVLVADGTSGEILLLTDIVMPVMDGIALIRRLSEEKRKVKVVVVSAYINHFVLSRMARLGAAGVLSKPMDLPHVAEVVKAVEKGEPTGIEPRVFHEASEPERVELPPFPQAEPPSPEPEVNATAPSDDSPAAAVEENTRSATALSSGPAATKPAAPAPADEAGNKKDTTSAARRKEKASPPREVVDKARLLGAVDGEWVRVLVADDDPDFGTLIRDVLDDEGYSVVLARDGLEAVEKVFTEDFYIVFMDLMMPGLGGTEAIRRIRVSEPGLLIVAMTGKAGPIDQAQAMQAGAFKVLEKPIDTEEFRKHLARWSLIAERRRIVTDKYARVEQPRNWLFRSRRGRIVALLLLLAVVLVGALVKPVQKMVWSAFRGIGSGFRHMGRAIGVLERTEGYLQRDEEREIRKNR